MMKLPLLLLLLLLPRPGHTAAADSTQPRVLTLAEAIRLAQEHSAEARSARHNYRTAYWNYRSFRANYLPSLQLKSSPYLNRQINRVTQPDGTQRFLSQNLLSTDLALEVSQNVWLTGGSLSLQTSLNRLDELKLGTKEYNAQPISVGYQQSLFGHNAQKWERRIEPVRFSEARKSYAETLELVASHTCTYFFRLATAQNNLEIARANSASADTLYRYARGRYRAGSISENEMLQLEVNQLSEETNVMSAQMEVDDAMQEFRSFLGLADGIALRVTATDSITPFEVDPAEAVRLAYANSPEPESFQLRRLEGRRQVSVAKAERRLKADLYLQFGLSQTSSLLEDTYRHPSQQLYASISVVIPLLDWGKARGKVKMAESQNELTEMQVVQAQADFEQNVRKMTRQFNLQARQLHVATRRRQTAQRRYEVALKLYLAGKSSLLDLNAAIQEKDTAQRGYIGTLSTYWSLYYGLRSMTQYDFERKCALEHTLELPVED